MRKKSGDHNLKTAKIGIRSTPLKLDIYFRFLTETQNVQSITFPSQFAKFGKIDKKIADDVVQQHTNRKRIQKLHLSKILLLLPVSSVNKYKISITRFYHTGYIVVAICRKKHGDQSLKTAKIGISTPPKSDIHFRFVLETIGVELTTFLSRLQYLVKVGNELWTTSFYNAVFETETGICASLKYHFCFRFC